jgi:hypothetical protein
MQHNVYKKGVLSSYRSSEYTLHNMLWHSANIKKLQPRQADKNKYTLFSQDFNYVGKSTTVLVYHFNILFLRDRKENLHIYA